MATDSGLTAALAFAALSAARYEREVREGLISPQQARTDVEEAQRILRTLGQYYHLTLHTEPARGELEAFLASLLRPRQAQ